MDERPPRPLFLLDKVWRVVVLYVEEVVLVMVVAMFGNPIGGGGGTLAANPSSEWLYCLHDTPPPPFTQPKPWGTLFQSGGSERECRPLAAGAPLNTTKESRRIGWLSVNLCFSLVPSNKSREVKRMSSLFLGLWNCLSFLSICSPLLPQARAVMLLLASRPFNKCNHKNLVADNLLKKSL